MDLAVLVVDGVADFGLAAVLETLNTANALRGEFTAPPSEWRVHKVGLSTRARTGHGHLVPTLELSQLSDSCDVIVVPAVNVLEADSLIELVSGPSSRGALEVIREMAAKGVHLAGACTGTFFLAEAGVLDGAAATTSWWLGPVFRRRYPLVRLDEGRILCEEERVTTAGAAVAHLELALSLVRTASPALAEMVARYMLIGNRREQVDFAIPSVLARHDPLIAELERWVRKHLTESLCIADVARALGVTERSLQRTTQAELGVSPREFVEQIRLQQAAHLLRTTSLTVEAIAGRIGYLNAGTLRKLIRRRRGMSVAELRDAVSV